VIEKKDAAVPECEKFEMEEMSLSSLSAFNFAVN
jgi:hypothetical protein